MNFLLLADYAAWSARRWPDRGTLIRHSIAGFTLIEVLVAMTLLATVAGLALAAQGVGGRMARDVLERETALWLAKSRLVEAAAYPDRSPPQDERPDRFEEIDYTTRIEYREISPIESIPANKLQRDQRLMEIRVVVTWGTRQPKVVQLSTFRRLVAK